MKRFKKEMTAAQNKYERIHGKVMLFGFWKYWLASGKIGPEEDDEAQLVHA
jgi:chitinase